MKCKILRTNESEINEFLASGIKVLSKHIVPKEIPEIAIFYETSEDDQLARDRAIIEQDVQMDRLLNIARQVSQDTNYSVFKNNTQKEIYLFTKYNLPKSDASVVIELLKPEMAAVLGA
jgi:hypothetical protein